MSIVPVHVSGGGPAGLAAAICIGRAGGRVIVHERRSGVGKRFHDDLQGLENWSTSFDVLAELESLGIQATFDRFPFSEAVIFGPSGRPHVYRSSDPMFYLVRRGDHPGSLDKSLARQATACGAELRFCDPVGQLPGGGIVAEGPRGCDAVAVGYVFQTDGANAVYGALSERLAAGGYAYLLVAGGHGTVATCLFEDFHNERAYLEQTVEFFEKTTGLVMRNPRFFGGTGSFSYPASARRRYMLYVGEAAGFQDTLWGFGMRYALLSGSLAARAWIENRPELYDRLWKRRLGGLMRSSVVNRWVYERAGTRGFEDLLTRLDRSGDPRRSLHGLYRPSWFKSMIFPVVKRVFARRRRQKYDAVAANCPHAECDCTWCRCAGPVRVGTH